MNLTSDSSNFAEAWPMLWLAMIILFAVLAWRMWFKKGKRK